MGICGHRIPVPVANRVCVTERKGVCTHTCGWLLGGAVQYQCLGVHHPCDTAYFSEPFVYVYQSV